MKVLVITGGDSSERKISLKSSKQVVKGLRETGFKVKSFDLLKGKDELEKQAADSDILFPVLHGEEGEGGELHKFLSVLGKPIVGTNNYKALQKAWHKIPFKQFCDKNKIVTSSWKKIKTLSDIKKFGFPSVLKASGGGSSLEVFILKSEKDMKAKSLKKILDSSGSLLIERYIKGVEVTVGILNNRAFPVVEIIPPRNEWFSYENKYSSKTKEIPNAPSLSETLRKKIQDTSLVIHKKLNIGAYSRIDFIVSGGQPFVLEVNTIPGLTAKSLFPKAAKAAGIEFPQLVEELVLTADH